MDPLTPHDDSSTDRSELGSSGGGSKEPAPKIPENLREFTIGEELGRGGFGSVYAAFDTVLQRDVAIKIPHPGLLGHAEVAQMYLEEARAASRLVHPNIVPVYKVSSTPDVGFFIVMMRVNGCHLRHWLRSAKPGFRQIVDVLAQVCDALAFAHDHEIVHRDIKLSNILIDETTETPYLSDFGLALKDDSPDGKPTFLGTPSYMSPEQTRGEGHRLDQTSDIFSLGVVMYFMLTGQLPFDDPSRFILFEQIQWVAPPVPSDINPDVPADLVRICMKALEKSRRNRFRSAKEMAAELRVAMLGDIEPDNDRVNIADDDEETPRTLDGSSQTIQRNPVVPKGLRAFDKADASFFLRLLPGP